MLSWKLMFGWLRGSRRQFSQSTTATECLRTFQQQSQQRVRARRFGIMMGAIVVPLSCLSLYERLSPLPDPLCRHKFPLLTRYYLRKSQLLRNKHDCKRIVIDLVGARNAAFAAGLGAASPQVTAINVYMAKVVLEHPMAGEKSLSFILKELCTKPHVGEAMEEELIRLEMGFHYVKRLYGMLPEEKKLELLENYETTIKRCPGPVFRRLAGPFLAFKEEIDKK